MSFAKEVLEAQELLNKRGHTCYLPEGVLEYAGSKIKKVGGTEGTKRKIRYNLIKKHHELISNSDAILVLNFKKRDIDNYIGGNAFLEMGFAHILGKKIYLFNQIPEVVMIKQEIEAMQPVILDGDLNRII